MKKCKICNRPISVGDLCDYHVLKKKSKRVSRLKKAGKVAAKFGVLAGSIILWVLSKGKSKPKL